MTNKKTIWLILCPLIVALLLLSCSPATIEGGEKQKVVDEEVADEEVVTIREVEEVVEDEEVPTPETESTLINIISQEEYEDNQVCYSLTVECNDLPIREAKVRATYLVNSNGAIIFAGGGMGKNWYGDSPQGAPIVNAMRENRFETYEIKWSGEWGWATDCYGEGFEATTGVFSEVVRWITTRLVTNPEYIAITGGSGGSWVIAYGLAIHNLEEVLNTVVLTSGPVLADLIGACCTYSRPRLGEIINYIMGWSDDGEDYCLTGDCPDWLTQTLQEESIVSPIPERIRDYDYPNTKVFFIEGELDDAAVDLGIIFYDAITSEKTWIVLPGVGHGVPGSGEGAAKIQESLLVSTRPSLPISPPPAPSLLPPPVPPDTVITFPDENLAEAIRNMLDIPVDDDITAADLATLTRLDAAKYGISDLTGIEYCVNLSNLNLEGNRLSDISPIGNLTSLTWIHLTENQISDISPLKNLTSLYGFSLGDNRISDISPLSSLTNLKNIYIWGNQISDISPLSSLTNINQLNIGTNQISDISPLENLTTLTWLGLYHNQIIDTSPLAYLTNLTWLDLKNNDISDISPLEDLISLIGLRLHENQISDISSLENLTSLTDLWLCQNQIRDISSLENLTRLYRLRIERNEISNVTPLANLTNLTELWLRDNQIIDISSLGSLANLTQLGLSLNEISDITPLTNLINLTWLDFEHNLVSDISPLANLVNLTELWLEDNQVDNISPLIDLTSLTQLALRGNNINDISALVENSGIDEDDEVWLEDNNLDLRTGTKDMENIEALEDRGVIVYYE